MEIRFDQRVAIVTGGSLGIGKEVARQVVSGGGSVAIVGRTRDTLERAAKELADGSPDQVLALVADVSVEEDLDRIVASTLDAFGDVHVLVNNAGVFDDDGDFVESTTEEWDRVLAINLRGPYLLTKRVAGAMMERGHGGAVVNLASIDGHSADGHYRAYNVSKAGIIQLSRQTAMELGPHGIRCNSVSPGWTRTPMVEAALTATQINHMSGHWDRVPLRRMTTTEEVANVVTFLASEAAGGVTGTDVAVDAGTMANLYILETLPE